MKTETANGPRQAKDRTADQAVKREERRGERAARLHVTVAELQAYTYKNGDASFLCSLTPTPQAK